MQLHVYHIKDKVIERSTFCAATNTEIIKVNTRERRHSEALRVESKVAIDCIKDNLFLNACYLSNTVSTLVASSTMREYCWANDHTTR